MNNKQQQRTWENIKKYTILEESVTVASESKLMVGKGIETEPETGRAKTQEVYKDVVDSRSGDYY